MKPNAKHDHCLHLPCKRENLNDGKLFTSSSPLMTWNSISMRTRLMRTSSKTRMTIPNCHVTPVSILANE